MPFDVSASGDEVVFGAFAPGGERVLGVGGDGGDLHELAGPFSWVKNVAVSGDGTTVAFDVIPLDNGDHEVGLVDFAGGDSRVLAPPRAPRFDDILHLSADGSSLLLTPSSYPHRHRHRRPAPARRPHSRRVQPDTSPRRRNGPGLDERRRHRFLYVMRHIRCADCANQHEQLATLDIGPANLGAAPVLTDAAIDPDEIANDSVDVATASIAITSEGTNVAAGVVALLDGVYDVNLAFGAILVDDGLTPDANANDDIFTNGSLRYSLTITRPDDTGPRTLRYQAEIETPDGLRHATAIDSGTLTVVAAS